MAIQSFTTSRHVAATKADGTPVKICLATVIHENGVQETVAIPEDLIAFEGEHIIEREVRMKVRH